jgi:hypothetical protein
MAESTGFISVHRQSLVEQQKFAKQLDLLHLVGGRVREPVKRLGLDLIDLRHNPRDFLFKGSRRSSRLFRLFALGKSENWRHSAHNKGNGKDGKPIL